MRGANTVTRAPRPSSSPRSDSEKATTAAFAAEYAAAAGIGTHATVEAMFTTVPEPCASIAGRTARVTRSIPNTWTSNIARVNAASVDSQRDILPPLPALLMTTSTRPNRSRIDATAAPTEASDVTSISTAKALPPPRTMLSASADSLAIDRAARTTRAPLFQRVAARRLEREEAQDGAAERHDTRNIRHRWHICNVVYQRGRRSTPRDPSTPRAVAAAAGSSTPRG
ncbi:hypothetical protein BE17_25550 [Sorangium cellulosum]|uniref:Uncharacterized protein n=1 Tax=Sorangium cellulosum TaxID=56 RepID=A0A150R0K7_SORCE|nr:hypothetical protein BE17_25550 [Sorangium cellulosum]